MFIATLIDENNGSLFLPAISLENLVASDVFVGVVEVESDMACGVLAAESLHDDQGGLVLAIREIFVDEAYRRKGAGRCLVRFLQDAAAAWGVGALICTFLESNKKLSRFLKKTGFYEEKQKDTLYECALSDLSQTTGSNGLTHKPLSKIKGSEWDALVKVAEKRDYAVNVRTSYDPKISTTVFDKDERPQGALLISDGEDGLFVEAMLPFTENNNSQLSELLYGACESAMKTRPPETKVSVAVHGDLAQELYILDVAKINAKKTDNIVTYTCETTVG